MPGKRKNWRDEFVPRDEFRCACGCELQLSRGDLQDAIMCAARLGGNPRTYGVTIKLAGDEPRDVKAKPAEPTTIEPCPSCGDPVELPSFAVRLLELKNAPWPICANCRKPSEEHHAREYWE